MSWTYCDVALENVQQLVGSVRDWVPAALHLVGTILGHLHGRMGGFSLHDGVALYQKNMMGDNRLVN